MRFPKRQRAIAAAVKSVRKDAGLTRDQLSKALRRAPNYISKIERLEKVNVSLAELEAIAAACGVRWQTLINRCMRG